MDGTILTITIGVTPIGILGTTIHGIPLGVTARFITTLGIMAAITVGMVIIITGAVLTIMVIMAITTITHIIRIRKTITMATDVPTGPMQYMVAPR